jgi:hypothetical protein
VVTNTATSCYLLERRLPQADPRAAWGVAFRFKNGRPASNQAPGRAGHSGLATSVIADPDGKRQGYPVGSFSGEIAAID